jgi:hypothetical protein
MAATGILAAAYNSVTTALTDAGLVVVTDPRNARPMSVFVELPIGDVFNNNIVDVRISLRILAAPPGNQDAANYLLSTFDIIHQLDTLAVVDFRPSTAVIGEQNIPAYDLTVRLSTRRN